MPKTLSEPPFPDAAMIHRQRERESRRPDPKIGPQMLAPDERQRFDAIRESHPFPEEEAYDLLPEDDDG